MCGTGPGSKRLGIDDDREAVPLTLQIIYSKVRPGLGLLPLQDLLLILPPPEPGPRAGLVCSWAPVFMLEGHSRLPWMLREAEGVDISVLLGLQSLSPTMCSALT